MDEIITLFLNKEVSNIFPTYLKCYYDENCIFKSKLF